jgi:hypothetical protein
MIHRYCQSIQIASDGVRSDKNSIAKTQRTNSFRVLNGEAIFVAREQCELLLGGVRILAKKGSILTAQIAIHFVSVINAHDG